MKMAPIDIQTNYGISYDLNEVTHLVATTRFEHDHYGTYRKQFITATDWAVTLMILNELNRRALQAQVIESVNDNPPMKSFRIKRTMSWSSMRVLMAH